MSELWQLTRGDGPLIVNVPHAGVALPAEIANDLTPAGLRLPDTDWQVEKLYDFVPAMGATLMVATHSRFVVDLNRDPSGEALYPGASNTEICPTSTFHDEPIYRNGAGPDAARIAARVERYWRPYHMKLAAEIERVRSRHGYCVLLDGHSIVSVAPRFFAGRLPDLNLGTADGTSCDPELAAVVLGSVAATGGFSVVHNGRFKGGYITRCYGRPRDGVHSLQLEMAQSCYMDEAAPARFDRLRAAPLENALRRLVTTLLNWRPALGGEHKK